MPLFTYARPSSARRGEANDDSSNGNRNTRQSWCPSPLQFRLSLARTARSPKYGSPASTFYEALVKQDGNHKKSADQENGFQAIVMRGHHSDDPKRNENEKVGPPRFHGEHCSHVLECYATGRTLLALGRKLTLADTCQSRVRWRQIWSPGHA
jgi:hypothetical protein